MPDQPFGVPQGAAEEGQHLHRGQDSHEGTQSGSECGATDDVARARQEPDGGRCRRQAEEPGQGKPSVRRARLGQHPPQGSGRLGCVHGTTPVGTAVATSMTASKRGRSTGSWAATMTVRPPIHSNTSTRHQHGFSVSALGVSHGAGPGAEAATSGR